LRQKNTDDDQQPVAIQIVVLLREWQKKKGTGPFQLSKRPIPLKDSVKVRQKMGWDGMHS